MRQAFTRRALLTLLALLALGSGAVVAQVRLRIPTLVTRIAPLQASDLTFIGQVNTPGTASQGFNLTMRYVGGERRFLAVETTAYISGDPAGQDRELIGDLVEYKVDVALKNGGSHWVDANVPSWTEVRRWKNWTTIARMKASGTTPYPGSGYSGQWKSLGGDGVAVGALYWDDVHSALWYSLIPTYPGAEIIWPPWNAVTLDDAEAGGDVSDGNRHGPYYFRSKIITDDWKDAAQGISPIDSTRQAAMGGTHIVEGTHMANIGSKGARSIGLWVVDGLPSPPARDTVLWPSAVHLYDTSPNSGKSAPNLHKPNIAKNAGYHGGNFNFDKIVKGGVAENADDGDAVGTAVNDAIYFTEEPYLYVDTVAVYMNTGASGGTWVPEIYNGSAWVQPTGWAVSVGTAALSGTENVFYWPKVSYSYSAAADALFSSPGYTWVRLRRTVSGSSGGSLQAAMATISMVGRAFDPASDQIPLPGEGYVGSYARPGVTASSYDASHYSYSFVEPMYGGAWVKTGNVEGFAYFGLIAGGGYCYCSMPSYFQPSGGGTPIQYESASLPATDPGTESTGFGWSNGPRWETPLKPYFLPFARADLEAAAADSSKRFSDFLNPASYTDLYDTFSGLISQYTVTNPRMSGETFYGGPRAYQYNAGSSTIFDPVTNQLIVLIPAYSTSLKNILAFFQVR
jgi:hypothetical protein